MIKSIGSVPPSNSDEPEVYFDLKDLQVSITTLIAALKNANLINDLINIDEFLNPTYELIEDSPDILEVIQLDLLITSKILSLIIYS